MMKYVPVLVTLLIVLSIFIIGCERSNPVTADSNSSVIWQQTNGPYGLWVQYLLSLDNSRDFVNSTHGEWFESTSAGISWFKSNKFPRYSAVRQMGDGSLLLVTMTGGKKTFARSTDKGDTWQSIVIPSTPSPIWISISKSGVWFLAANQDGIYRSTNIGVSWTRFTSGLEIPTNPAYLIPVFDVLQIGDSTCLAIGSSPLRISTNCGLSWSMTPLGYRGVMGMMQIDDQTVLVGTDMAIFRTTDMGAHWDSVCSEAASSFSPRLTDGSILSSNYNSKSINYSLDNGLHWSRISAPVASAKFAVNSNGTVLAGDDYTGLYRSTDNGNSWSEAVQGIAATPVYELVSVGSTLLAYHYKACRSTDYGTTWSAVDLPTQFFTLFFHYATSRGDTVFAGSRGVYRSVDAGATWGRLVSADGLGTVSSVAANSNGDVYFGTREGKVYKSTNAGGSWTLTNKSIYVSPVHFLSTNDNGIVLMSDDWTGLALSTDHGATWNLVRNLSEPNTAIAVAADNTLFVGNNDGVVYRSSDLGTTWQRKPLSDTYGHNVEGFAFPGGSVVLVGSYGGGVHISRDNGNTWSQAITGLDATDATSIASISTGYVFVGTDGAGVFRSINSVK